MLIGGVENISLLDFPGKIAAVIFTVGCPFRCVYCHNPELVVPERYITSLVTVESFFKFLQSRQGKLEGVCITGGEPLVQKDIALFIEKIKELGFAVKLDTNGFFPQELEKIIQTGLIDYLAMDIKGPLESYAAITQIVSATQSIAKSIKLIMNSGIDYEFRTTVTQEILNINDFEAIGTLIQGAKRYFIQNYVTPPKQVETDRIFTPFTNKQLIQAKKIMQKHVTYVDTRPQLLSDIQEKASW